jgi:hypothetical protein
MYTLSRRERESRSEVVDMLRPTVCISRGGRLAKRLTTGKTLT